MNEIVYTTIENWMSRRGLDNGIDEDILEEAITDLKDQIHSLIDGGMI